MAPTARLWISVWFFVSTLVVFWDAGYCLLRPRSMEGGDLNWIWTPYNLYAKIDYVYGLPALENNEGFTSAQGAIPERCRELHQSGIPVHRSRSQISGGTADWVHWCRNDVLEDGAILGAGVLLRVLQDRPQHHSGYPLAVGPAQWRLAAGTWHHHLRPRQGHRYLATHPKDDRGRPKDGLKRIKCVEEG